MDEDLLDKYFAGKCTAEEAVRVRSWLDNPVLDEERLLKKSWRHVHRYIRAGAIRPLRPWVYLAAASVSLLLLFGIGGSLLSRHVEIQNNSRHYDAFNASGLQLRLPPQASARVDLSLVSHRADLVFCGDVRIHNTSQSDVEMKLNLNCTDGNPHDRTTSVIVRKDKKYLAFQYHFKSDEVVIVEEDRLFDLPLPLQQKALKALKI
nr:hypothetical protein [uncultured Dyadobacter sp.]